MKKLLQELGVVSAIIGAQWGDEGKGKIVDLLAEHFDIVARASGGANAGHTIVVSGKKHVFHLLPSGCLHEGKPIVLGAGMVVHLPTLLEEIRILEEAGIDVLSRLSISHGAHIVFDYHKMIDGVVEDRRSSTSLRDVKQTEGIGTTRRGIGPAYADKAYRTGFRMGDLVNMTPDEFKRAFQHNASFIHKMFDIHVLAEKELADVENARELLMENIIDTTAFLHHALNAKETILIEGAQATLLDIDHGTYPYVTSSQTTIMGALQGLGLPPKVLTSVIGVVKAYCTRVGGGPFPSEVAGPRGDALRERGGEYGATTGRPRRCGWLSLSDLAYACRLNGFTHLNVTKLDVLDAEKDIPVFDREKEAVLPGWQESTKGITEWKRLPKNAQEYIEYIEKKIGVPVSFVGTGPGREEMMVREQ
ncbi:MAG TPA: adenylosuccinate synthase [Candidatus Peribacterales bacterium]|nr:adenylosuccinate synthase [Candidatus Peribacterales bacterium]